MMLDDEGLVQRKKAEAVSSLYLMQSALGCSFRSLLQMLLSRLVTITTTTMDFCMTGQFFCSYYYCYY